MRRSLLDLVVAPACWSCRAPLRGGALCAPCERVLPWLDRPLTVPRGGPLAAAWAPLAFAGPARDLVHALKFHGAAGVAGVMAAHVTDGIPPYVFARGWTLVPVPAHPGRRRRRGFDHADLLARALARRCELPLVVALQRDGGAGAVQRGRRRAERLAGGAVGVRATCALGAPCLLVDDVRTTGATAAACAAALRAAGAPQVVAVSYAHVP
ncbi:MAG TPA: hypothetical protein VII98_00565 [Solirubrobacteraceae bacterium]